MTTSHNPLRADAERNRARILQIAQAVFATEGLAVPISAIARRAGLGVGTVYRHFPTKEALFEAIVLDRMERLVEKAQSLADGGEPGSSFFAFLEHLIETGTAKKDLVDALAGSGVDLRRGPALGVAKNLRAALGGFLSRAQRAGTVREDVGVEEIMALLKGVFAANDGYAGPTKGRARIFEVVRDGLGARPRKRTA